MELSLKLLLLASVAFLIYWLGHSAFAARRKERPAGTNRSLPRFPVQWPVEIDTAEGVRRGVTQNISCSGMFVLLHPPLLLGQCCDVRIAIPGERSVQARVEVVWSVSEGTRDEPGRTGMGLLFAALSPDDRNLIDACITPPNDPS